MICIKSVTSSNVSFDTIAKSGDSSFYASEIPTFPITSATLVACTNVIHKRMRMTPTMTSIIFGDNVK